MDVFLVQQGIIVNVAAVISMAQAQVLFQDFDVIERTPANCHLNIGDTI
jgi:hypothetical protein